MKNTNYIPLQIIQRIERDYPGIYSALTSTDFNGKKEFEVIEKMIVSKQREKFFPRLYSGEIDTLKMAYRGINDIRFLVITKDWIQSKQVYSFSKEFINILYRMDDFEINADLLNYLPFSSFYVELPKNKYVHGVLIKYSKAEKVITFCTCYYNLSIDEGLNTGIMDLNLYSHFSEFAPKAVGTARNEKERKELSFYSKLLSIVFQICMYLCSENSDIHENEEQKRIYRPSKSVKNHYSEIRKWDVGYRVMQEHKKIEQNAKKEWHENHPNDRRRPRMHWRKAHWHTFCCGTGRKERKIKFIAPILVNELQDDELPVVNRAK